MNARFRIRTRDGRELEPRTLETFSEIVRSGLVQPQDLVYDALTGEWIPAGTHPMVRLVQDPLVHDLPARSLDARLPGGGGNGDRDGDDDAGPGGSSSEPAAADVDVEAFGAPDAIPLSLVEESRRSPEEEQEAFIRQMQEERRADPDHLDLDGDLVLDGARPRLTEASAPSSVQETGDVPPVSFPAVVNPPPRRVRHRTRRRWRAGVGWVILAGVVAVGAVIGIARAGGGVGRTPQEPSVVGAERRVRGVNATETEIRAQAYQAFLRAVDGVRGTLGLGEVPPVWLEGTYLADASGFPEVRRYWERALEYAQNVQALETDLYRGAYLAAAEDAGLAGPVRSLRLATAVEDFAAAGAARTDQYRRMWELATAALSLHGTLVELGDRVRYEPMEGPRVSAAPVLEAAGTDPEAQLALEAALDRVLEALRGPDGNPVGDRSRVSSWLVEGLRGAAARGMATATVDPGGR